MSGPKKTPARKACDRAAKACDGAWRAMRDLMDHTPGEHSPMMLRQLTEFRELADYLEICKWPDETEPPRVSRRPSAPATPDLFASERP